ncbi:hypothetical protein [Neptunomonas qingdaonensis]|uniref:hypothetical protein n=1 Tax=Neptunomonas qingdaonensis TaxID=1045558 RepID=UPI0015A5F2A7|nr:hypothetical protein [Neptunomonas qingdaonensis]
MAVEQTVEHLRAERRRHQYLEAMGVTSWLPRSALPGARPSHESVYEFLYGHEADVFESDDVAEDASHISEKVHHQQAVAPVTAASLDLLAPSDRSSKQRREAPTPHDSLTRSSVAAGVTATVVQDSDQTSVQARTGQEPSEAEVAMPHVEIKPRSGKEKAPRFRLGFWLYKDLLVVDSLPLLSRGGITQGKYQALCANMVKAMGLDAELLAAPYVLAWPMLAGDSLDQGKAEASLAVKHKIQKLLQQATPRLLLFLGESAAQMGMQREEGIDELRAVVFNYSSQIKAMTSLSLTQMLQIPECKKEVWGDLQKVLPVNA